MGRRARLKKRLSEWMGRKPIPTQTEVAAVSSQPPMVEEAEEEAVELEVDDEQLSQWLGDDQEAVLLDIREPMEIRNGYAKGALLIPMNSIPDRLAELPEKDVRLLVYCAAGVRSFGVTHWLREQGWDDSWSVTGGLASVLHAGAEFQRD